MQDAFGEFSNFYKAPVTIEGLEWPTTEHYFQAQKFVGHPHAERIRTVSSCTQCKKLGQVRTVPMRSDWEKVKHDVMYTACLAKFTQHASLKKILLSTGNALLVEHTRNDKYWGDGGDGSGKNMLGKTLVRVRDTLRSQEGIQGEDQAEGAEAAAAMASSTATRKRRQAGSNENLLLEKSGDLLTAPEKYIVQQCNVVSKTAKGLAAHLFKKYPHADVYSSGHHQARVPGTISVHGNPGRCVINLYGQVCPGKTGRGKEDSRETRLRYFESGLNHIAQLPNLESIAFPFQ